MTPPPQLMLPVLLLAAGDDTTTTPPPPPATSNVSDSVRFAQQLFDVMGSNDKILLSYGECRWRLLQELEHALVVADVAQWLARVVSDDATGDDQLDVVLADEASVLAALPVRAVLVCACRRR